MKKGYIFQSERLGFRNWVESDKQELAQINSDPKVMEYFPSTPTVEQTIGFIGRMQEQFKKNRFCYFAVDKLTDNSLIGFIGFSEQVYEAKFTPCVDIGWRLSQSEWGYGYATEGAKRCLDYAFNDLSLDTIKSVCTLHNAKSEHVMKKIGMMKVGTFLHPLLKDHKELEECLLYQVSRSDFRS